MTCDATKTIVSAAPQLTEPRLVEFTNFMYAVAEKLHISELSETDHSLDTQVTLLPSVEVSVKALIMISSVALPAAPSASTQVLLCAHHPYLVGTTNGDAVWKRLQKYMHARNFDIMSIILSDLENLFKSLLGPMLLSSTNQSERQAAVSSLSTLMSFAPEQTYAEFEKHLKNLSYRFSHDTISENDIRNISQKAALDNYFTPDHMIYENIKLQIVCLGSLRKMCIYIIAKDRK